MPAEIEDWPSDEVLLQQARSGNRTAFARFATRWWGPLYRIAWNMLGNASEAAGATQRALRLVVRFPGSRVCDASFRAAMYGVAIEVTTLPTMRSGRRSFSRATSTSCPGASKTS